MSAAQRRTGFALLAAVCLANAGVMLAAPAYFYDHVPGVAATGPANPHFLRDIALGFALAGLSFGLAVRRPGLAAAWPGLAWLVGHAGLHLVETLASHGPHGPWAAALATIYAPAGLAVLLVWPPRPGPDRQRQTP